MEGFHQLHQSFHLTFLQFARWKVDLAMLKKHLVERGKSAKLPFLTRRCVIFTLCLHSGQEADVHAFLRGKSLLSMCWQVIIGGLSSSLAHHLIMLVWIDLWFYTEKLLY